MSVSSPIKWHGGKHYMLPTLRRIESRLSIKPLVRAEHFGGSLAWTLDHDPNETSEVVNDLNGPLSNFWKCLASGFDFQMFAQIASITPFSESVWNDAEAVPENNIHQAVNFFIRCRQSLAGRMKAFAPISTSRTRRGMNEQVSAWLSAVDGLPEVHARLRRVLILSRDFAKSIEATDSPRTLHYLDPPYMHETRASTGEYEHEMTTEDHRRMLSILKNDIKGKAMVSGYANPLYQEYLLNWQCEQVELPNNAAGGKSKRRMVECVWSNF